MVVHAQRYEPVAIHATFRDALTTRLEDDTQLSKDRPTFFSFHSGSLHPSQSGLVFSTGSCRTLYSLSAWRRAHETASYTPHLCVLAEGERKEQRKV